MLHLSTGAENGNLMRPGGVRCPLLPDNESNYFFLLLPWSHRPYMCHNVLSVIQAYSWTNGTTMCTWSSLLHNRVSSCSGSEAVARTFCSSSPHLTKTPKAGVTQTGFAEATGRIVAGNRIILIPCSGVGGPELGWIFFRG